jgi:hypothetical protein
MNRTAVGVDIAKNVFQVHYIDQDVDLHGILTHPTQ